MPRPPARARPGSAAPRAPSLRSRGSRGTGACADPGRPPRAAGRDRRHREQRSAAPAARRRRADRPPPGRSRVTPRPPDRRSALRLEPLLSARSYPASSCPTVRGITAEYDALIRDLPSMTSSDPRTARVVAPALVVYTCCAMPTTRPRLMITETDELAEALDAAAVRWPEVGSRRELLLRLVAQGRNRDRAGAGGRGRAPARGDPAHERGLDRRVRAWYLERLRDDWPA